MTIDFYHTEPHFGDHLRPVYEALAPEVRGRWYRADYPRQDRGAMVCVASFGDLKRVHRVRMVVTESGHYPITERNAIPAALFEHGAGFTFQSDREMAGGSYAGGPLRDSVSIFPSTNRWVQSANFSANPHTPAPIVGCPKLDALLRVPRPIEPCIAVSFHWECRVVPETRNTLPHYRHALLDLRDWAAANGVRMIGHGHPRGRDDWSRLWRGVGVPYVPNFADVVAQATCYVTDGSSTLYEFAALDRPVVVLNAPWYRRDVHHGLRFWEHADVGRNCNEPEDLIDAVMDALDEPAVHVQRRRDIIADVYPFLGESADRAARVLTEHMETL